MKITQLITELERIKNESGDREVGFYDESNRKFYESNLKPVFVDETDEYCLMLSFNLTKEQIEEME